MPTTSTTGRKSTGKQAKRRKNATSFKPGQSGNPRGRPPGVRSMARLLDEIGNQSVLGKGKGPGADYRAVVARKLWFAAATGWLNLGESSRRINMKLWMQLVTWMFEHLEAAAIRSEAFGAQAVEGNQSQGENGQPEQSALELWRALTRLSSPEQLAELKQMIAKGQGEAESPYDLDKETEIEILLGKY